MSSQRQRRLDIIPDGFVDAYGGDTIEEALERAERAKSTTPKSERRLCPSCTSVQVRYKPQRKDFPNARPETYCCKKCRDHFNNPIPSINKIVEREFGELTDSLSDASSNANALAAVLRLQEER